LTAIFCASALAKGVDPVQPVQPFEVEAYEDANGVSAPDAEQAVALQHQGAGIVEQLQQSEGTSYSGVWFDVKTSKFVVPMADPSMIGPVRRLLAANKLNDAYRIDPVQATWSELLNAQRSLDKTLKDEIRADLVQTSLDPRRDAVVISEAAELSTSARNEIKELRRSTPERIVIDQLPENRFQAEPAACTTWTPSGGIPRRICDRPLRGGVLIEGVNSELPYVDLCSAGFTATGKTLVNHFLLTAGHCVQGFKQWRSEEEEMNLH
jgi:hypothetical protein